MTDDQRRQLRRLILQAKATSFARTGEGALDPMIWATEMFALARDGAFDAAIAPTDDDTWCSCGVVRVDDGQPCHHCGDPEPPIYARGQLTAAES